MYFINKNELDSDKKTFIKEKIEAVNFLVDAESWTSLDVLEHELLSTWNAWRQRLELVMTQDQPNTPEQLLEARSYLTMYNEVLLHIREVSPHSKLVKY